jgi:hypothetical protein
VQSYRLYSLGPTSPTSKHGSNVRTTHANARNIGLKIGHFHIQCKHFGYAPLVNSHLSRIANRSRGGFSSDQWLSSSTFASKSHPSRQNLLTFHRNYQLYNCLLRKASLRSINEQYLSPLLLSDSAQLRSAEGMRARGDRWFDARRFRLIPLSPLPNGSHALIVDPTSRSLFSTCLPQPR